MRRAVEPHVHPPLFEPPDLVKLQASIPAPPATEGLLTRAHLARHLCPAVKPLPGSALPPETCRRCSRACLCLLSRPAGFRGLHNACARESRV